MSARTTSLYCYISRDLFIKISMIFSTGNHWSAQCHRNENLNSKGMNNNSADVCYFTKYIAQIINYLVLSTRIINWYYSDYTGALLYSTE